jgi:nitrile hydratase accessory protein
VSIPKLAPLPGQPHDADGPVFREAWEAQAFAMALVLHERRVFTWKEWSAALAEEIKKAQATGDPDLGTTYYSHWLKTLERLVVEKAIATEKALLDTATAWRDAALATPHGRPIVLGRTSMGD